MCQPPLAESKPRFWWGLEPWLHTRRLREENGASGSVNFVWLTPEYETHSAVNGAAVRIQKVPCIEHAVVPATNHVARTTGIYAPADR
jgi:hypothetical protein